MVQFHSVSAKQLAEISAQRTVDLIDVRTPVEFREVHASGAMNVPLDSLDPAKVIDQRVGDSGDPIYLICKSGARGARACQEFQEAGFDNVINVDGGTTAWEEAGLSVQRGKKAISLERQVRIAAGLLVLIGCLLGAFVHPYFVALSLFVGAGLMFAGITDTCAMGQLLAKMPWNQVGDSV